MNSKIFKDFRAYFDRRYSTEMLTSDVAAVRCRLKAVKDQLQSCRDIALNSGVAAFFKASLCFLVAVRSNVMQFLEQFHECAALRRVGCVA